MRAILRDRAARLAAGGSVALHLLILLLFLLVKLNLWPQPPEFTEIVLLSGTSRLAAESAKAKPAADISMLRESALEPSDVVTLPMRPMREQEQPVRVPDQPIQVPQEPTKTILEPVATQDRAELAALQPSTTNAEQKLTVQEADGLAPSDKPLPTTTISSDVPSHGPYQIEGQAAGRTVIYKVIPEYPPDRQVMATIKISFTVLPNGNVGTMIPMIKSDALLEKITLDALRQWKFNPLPADVPQRVERGVITFRYLLK